jgi:short-subunit dehydrogenase
MKNLKDDFGPWAVVTGASSGIGKEFARQLAAQGFNLVLLARREHLLKQLADDLLARHAVQVKYVVLDLASNDFLTTVDEELAELKVRLLISNAGAAHMGAFTKLGMDQLDTMLKLNVTAQMKLSHWFANRLIERSQTGGLMLVSSSIAYQGTPYAANYSAAKAYILNLGEALNYELREQSIQVSVLVPGPTDAPGLTERQDANMKDNLPMKPQPVDELVREGLQTLVKNKPYHIGGGMNRFVTGMMGLTMSRARASAFWGKKMKEMVYLK